MIHTMHRGTLRRTGAVGNTSQIVLMLRGTVEQYTLQETLDQMCRDLPLLGGKILRNFRGRVFWKTRPLESVRLEQHAASADTLFGLLSGLVNRPFQRGEYICFHQISISEKQSAITLTFDHRLLDAKGAEQLMLLISKVAEQTEAFAQALPETNEPDWQAELKSGLQSARLIGQTVHGNVIGSGMVQVDPEHTHTGNSGFFRIRRLTEAQTAEWMRRAEQDAGYLMFMPFTLAAASHAFKQFASKRKMDGSFIIPCTTDLRPQPFAWNNTFFNWCSLFFFKVEAEDAGDKRRLIDTFKKQFFDQTKNEFPQKFARFMGVMRMLPLQMFEWMNRCNHASFSFASVGESLFDGSSFMGVEVEDLFHMPLIPPYVGFGFFVNRINGRMNVGLSWREGALSHDEAEALEHALLNF